MLRKCAVLTQNRPVPQTIGSKVDPKSVLCMFFKQGLCTKGDKCKFSHDLSVEAKAEKRSIYFDERDDEGTVRLFYVFTTPAAS